MTDFDLIVPVKNEEENIKDLVVEIDKSLRNTHIKYRIIFVVDKSTDNTISEIKKTQKKFPVVLHEKEGRPGKGFSILEGLGIATAEYVGFIDGDLQYSPSHLPLMLEKITKDDKVGVVIANRKSYHLSTIRKLISRANALLVGRVLLGMNTDIQSGLKVFRRSIGMHMRRDHVTAWTFDIPLLSAAREAGYTFDEVEIDFEERKFGVSKVGIIKTSWAVLKCAIKTRFAKHRVLYLDRLDNIDKSIIYKGKKYTPHTNLDHNKSAIFTLMFSQKIVLLLVVVTLLTLIILRPLDTFVVLIAILSTIYFLDVFFNLFLIMKSLHTPPEIQFDESELSQLQDKDLPLYTILCPLYKESEVLPYFVANIEKFDWPKDKLEVLLLLEENDKETQEAAAKMKLPDYYQVMVVPHSMPKTKPKACNYGLYRAKGEFVVIYDAEDKPEVDQLKKAYLAFQKLTDKTVCVQAKLNYYNTHHNLLTRLFTAEYSLWFDVILPGLQSINTTIPLGGTSNHFKTEALKSLHGWDPFNVTEDCDLGVRLFKDGYQTAIIDSTTYEEANSDLKNWIRQRSRWIKGYMQTYLVHMRNPSKFLQTNKIHAIIFQLIIGLRIYFILINPILWATTIAYFVLYAYVGPTIESLYPAPVFYMAVVSLIFGNFTYLYNYMIGCAKRKQWTVVKFVFFVPFYWVFTSIAAGMAFYQLIFNPHHWEKTNHGLHLKQKSKIKSVSLIWAMIPSPKFNIKFNQYGVGVGIYNLLNKFKTQFRNGEVMLVFAAIVGNLLNFIYNIYLSRKLDVVYFGEISLFGNFLLISSILFSALSTTVTYESGYIFGKYGQAINTFWKSIRPKALYIGLIFWGIWLILIPSMLEYFHDDAILPYFIFAPIWVIGMLASVDYGYLFGNHKFKIISVFILSEAISKLLITISVIEFWDQNFVLIAIPLSMLLSLGIAFQYARKLGHKSSIEIFEKDRKFPYTFFGSSLFHRFSIITFISFDMIIARHILSPSDAGYYSLLALVGKMVFLVSSLVGQFLVPYISKKEGESHKGYREFLVIFILTALLGGGAYFTFGLLGKFTVPFILGEKVMPVVRFLSIYSFAILLFTLSSTIIGYHQVKQNYKFPITSVILSVLQIIYLSFFVSTLSQFVHAIFYMGLINMFIIVLLHLVNKRLNTIYGNLLDFIDLFSPLPESIISNEKRKILFLNWRDTKHIWSGGAEIYVHEIAKCMVREGIGVVVFCGNDQRSTRNDEIDGVHIIRRGGMYTVYIWAFLYYVCKFRGKFDLVIDSENGIPFFSPLYVRIPIIGLVHHIHRDIIIKELELSSYLIPLAYIARVLESNIMPYVYRNVQMITVSNSTRDDMKKLGFGKQSSIEIIHPGIEVGKFVPSAKTDYPSILYLGRIKPYKSIDVAIRAVHKLVNDFPNVVFNIAGFGEYQKELQNLVKSLKIDSNVRFLGKVSEEIKLKLMAESWVFVYPSVWEGWGISVIEANACGTPVVASKVPGLKDSVNNPHSGYLVEYGNINEFAIKIKVILSNSELREKFATTTQDWANKFTWNKSTRKLVELIEQMEGLSK